MVFNSSFLIVEVSPANNELNVAINKGMTVRFSMDMDVSRMTNGTLLLHKVNGEAVDCTVTYDRTTRTAGLQPKVTLSAGTKYRFTVLGGSNGVSTVTGSLLPESKIYEFTTTGTVALSVPTSFIATVVGSKVTLDWLQPDQYDPQIVPQYEAYVSRSNLDPDADPGSVVWPLATDAMTQITQTSIIVGRELPSDNYYAYVRAVTEKQDGPWASTQFYIAPVITGGSGGDSGGGTTTLFEVRETYPKADSVNIMPNTVKVLFTSNLDMTTINTQTVYILKKKKPDQLSIIDLMTEYAPGGIAYTVDTGMPANLLSLTIDPTVFETNSEYTLILRETIKDTSGNALGEPYSWSFTSTYDPLFGDPAEIREDVKGFLTNIPDKILYSYMSNISKTAYDTAERVQTALGTFDSVTFLEAPPRYMGQYVRVRATYDLLVNAYLERSSSAGSVCTLGDLTIDNSNTPDITRILSAFKDRIKPWEDELHGLHNRGYAKPSTAVRGEAVEVYPDYYTRDLKDVEA